MFTMAPLSTIHPLLQLAIAGAAGTLARYWLGGFVQWLLGSGFPWGTAVINVSGCLLFGFVWTLAEDRLLISPQTRMVVLTGFMGAFTTFSTFAFETTQMFADSEWARALGNVALQNVLGVAAVMLGFAIGRQL
jgi:CrcB protein